MNRKQLAHILRAAARVTEDSEIIVLGSQAILGTYSEDVLPEEALRSMEADLAFRNDPDEQKSDRVDGAIGELSRFHSEFGYYGQGVSIDTAVLPAGWEQRVVRSGAPDRNRAVFVDPHDLVVAKLVAGREKDFEFATALISTDLIAVETLLERVKLLDQPGAVINRVKANIERCQARAKNRVVKGSK